jgi:hypothetical protein
LSRHGDSDVLIYQHVLSFFRVADDVLWHSAGPRSYITKTVGIQALFDVLRSTAMPGGLAATPDYGTVLSSASHVDFSDPLFQASGKGRTRIKNTLLFCAGILDENDLPTADRDHYIGLRSRGRGEA